MNASITSKVASGSETHEPFNGRIEKAIKQLSGVGIVAITPHQRKRLEHCLENLYIDAWGDCEDELFEYKAN